MAQRHRVATTKEEQHEAHDRSDRPLFSLIHPKEGAGLRSPRSEEEQVKVRHAFAVKVAAAAVVAIGLLVGSSAAAAGSASNRGGTLKIFKECSEYTGLTGSFCTIKTSTLKQIEAGSKVVYLQPKALASDVILTSGPGTNKAYGNCALNKAGNGKCTFTRGTGTLAGFHAELRVTHLGDPSASPFFYWAGPYSFGQ
jgi:hypothetical protein